MELSNEEEFNEASINKEELKIEGDKSYFGGIKDSKETEFKKIQAHSSDGSGAPKPNDVRNGDLVSLLLAATPPYFYNVPMVPQTFFFSEMLKSFVQAKAERQNLKAQQSHNRRQRKRAWKEMTPPNALSFEVKDKPLELTIPKQIDDKPKGNEKNGIKKYQLDKIFINNEKKYQNSKFESSNFTIEKLTNSNLTTGQEIMNGNNNSGDFVPPTPPMWYPFLYPPPPPYGIDPLHFFIDLRVSAHFWNKKIISDSISQEKTTLNVSPYISYENGMSENPFAPVSKLLRKSAFSVPAMRTDPPVFKNTTTKKNLQNVHYIVSSLRNIYKILRKDEEENKKKLKPRVTVNKNNDSDKNCKDLGALIGLELVVNYFHQKRGDEKN